MQADNADLQRNQLVDALRQCGQHLRTTASMLDSYAALLQNVPATDASFPIQNMFQMFASPQTGAHPGLAPVPGAPNGFTLPAATPAPTRGRKRRDAVEVDDGTGKKRRRRGAGEKKEKDPNAPKRPPSAYLLFQNEVREEMKKLYPDRPYLEVLNKISERWSKMTDEEKKAYTDATNDMRVKFEADKAAYTASHSVQNGTGPAAAIAPEVTPAAPSAPAVPVVAAAAVAEDDNEESDEEHEETSEVSAAVVHEAEGTPSDVESLEASSSEGDDEDVLSKPTSKKGGRPASKRQQPAKPASKAEKENKKKDIKKSK